MLAVGGKPGLDLIDRDVLAFEAEFIHRAFQFANGFDRLFQIDGSDAGETIVVDSGAWLPGAKGYSALADHVNVAVTSILPFLG